MLTRYWFRFAKLRPFSRLSFGCRITAYDQEDAVAILQEHILAKLKEFPEIAEIVPNIDVRTLDQKHVIPHMDPPVWRGVWFPRGF